MTTIRPFAIDVPASELDELHTRLERTRWPDELPGVGWSYGTALDHVRELAGYWRHGFDWPARQERLNRLPQYTTTVDGQTIHFVHATSPEPDALPLLLTHGWPSTFADFAAMVGPLTDPRAHGGDPADAFDVVIPSVPGFAFSGPTTETGWDVHRVATAWAKLMSALGYRRYGVQGSDFGALVTQRLARLAPDHIVGMHLNAVPTMPEVDPAERDESSVEEREYFQGLERWDQISGYAVVQSTRPQTLAYALSDSPVGQLAWYGDWYAAHGAKVGDLAADDILTNVSLFWFTGTAGSAARLYKESGAAWGESPGRCRVPTGMTFFAGEHGVRRFAEREYDVRHWTRHEVGGHFAALEVPEALTADIRTFFRAPFARSGR